LAEQAIAPRPRKRVRVQKVAPGYDPGDGRLVYDEPIRLVMDRMDEIPERNIRRYKDRIIQRPPFPLARAPPYATDDSKIMKSQYNK
jgi:hypothetical protein